MVISRKNTTSSLDFCQSFHFHSFRQAVLFLGPEEGKLHLKPWEASSFWWKKHVLMVGDYFWKIDDEQ